MPKTAVRRYVHLLGKGMALALQRLDSPLLD